MFTTTDYLDSLRVKTGVPSDYALQPILGVTRSAISKYRTKREFFSDDMAFKVARILEIDPILVISAIHAERAKTQEEKAAWTGLFEKLGGMAASVMLGIMLSGAVDSNEASASTQACHNSDHSIHYAK